MATAKALTEDELTPSRLKKFFERIYLKASLNERGYLRVEADNVLPVFITQDQHRKLLKFLVIYDNEDRKLGIKHANRLNDSYILARFSVSEQGDCISIDYQLPYEGGITPYQLLAVLRVFSKAAASAIHEEWSQTYEEAPGSITPERVLN
jgi:hypothetical protein